MTAFAPARIAAARRLAPEITHLTIALPPDPGAASRAGGEAAVRFPSGGGRIEERHYSIWRHDPAAGTVELCVVLHGLGEGSRWAARCAPGDSLEVSISPNVPVTLVPGASEHVFLGDETSIATADALMRETAAGSTRLACFETETAGRRWPGAELADEGAITWLERAGRPGMALLSWLAPERFSAPPTASVYVTGEAWLCANVQAKLVKELGFLPGSVRALPFWKRRPAPGETSWLPAVSQ